MFKDKLKSVSHVTLTTDIWTDIQTKSFLGVTVHYIENNSLASSSLGVIELTESHAAQYISTELVCLLNDWGIHIDKVIAVVTDNGANMVKAICDTFGRNWHIPCFAHTLNLVCENAIKGTDVLVDLLYKVRSLVTWVKKSVHNSDE